MTTLKLVNNHLFDVTIESIEDHKNLTDSALYQDLSNLKAFDASTNNNSFYGNPFLYNFQLRNLLKCKRDGGKTLYDVWNDKIAWDKLIESTRKRNRGGRTASGNVYEAFRINTGSVVMFKSTTAKYLYGKYGATKVLDTTAGWGGRMLGAWALDIDYIGIDTNVNMMDAYTDMMEYMDGFDVIHAIDTSYQMIWGSCLDVDFSKLEYDFVLTSPPYINMEVYEHMDKWKSDDVFYREFFLPLWEKSVRHIIKGGHVCFNISPKMYKSAIGYGLPQCDLDEELKQQTGATSRSDKTYIWKC